MNDLISRSALIEKCCDDCNYPMKKHCKDDPCPTIHVVMDAPTVDAVQVVRCKDCKHNEAVYIPLLKAEQMFCKLHKGLAGINEESFCSYGKRRGADE